MSYSDNDFGWQELDDDFPDLLSEEGRDSWVEILMSHEVDDVNGWCKAITAADDQGNMVARFIYPDGKQEVFDLTIRRTIDVSSSEGERN